MKYLRLIRDIRDNNHELFKKIEEIPKKARVARTSENKSLISLMKTGKFKKVFKTDENGTEEIDFFDAIEILQADEDEKAIPVNPDYYKYLKDNVNAFETLLNAPEDQVKLSKNENSILKYINFTLQNKRELTTYDINFLTKVRDLVSEGHITKNQAKVINTKLKTKVKDIFDIIDILRKYINEEDLKTDTAQCIEDCVKEYKQIILSEYFYNG